MPSEKDIRADFKQKLLKRNILPKTGPYTKPQEKISDLLKASRYDEIKEYVKAVYSVNVDERYYTPRPYHARVIKKVEKEKRDPKEQLKRTILLKLVKDGLVSEDDDVATDIQREIKDKVLDEDMKYAEVISKYVDHSNVSCKQKFIYQKAKASYHLRKDKGMAWDIKPEDIIINEYCPFLETKLRYKRGTTKEDGIPDWAASNDRFDNSKGYVKGNVWVISSLANVIKNAATIEELKTFCYNVLRIYYENNPNNRF